MKIITSKGQKFDIRDKTDDEIYRMNKKDAISYKWKYLLLKSSILILFFYVFVLEYLNVRNLIRHTEPKSVQIFLGIVCCAIISILVVLSQIYDNVSFEYFHKMKLVEKYERNKELVSDLKQYPIEKIEIKNDQLFVYYVDVQNGKTMSNVYRPCTQKENAGKTETGECLLWIGNNKIEYV